MSDFGINILGESAGVTFGDIQDIVPQAEEVIAFSPEWMMKICDFV